MQTLPSSRTVRPSRLPLVAGTIVGSVLLFGGLGLAALAMTTPLLSALTPAVLRPGPEQLALGAVVWGTALVAPPAFAIVGAVRLGRVVRTATARPRTRAVARVSAALGDEYLVAVDARLPDGRLIPELVVGPFGLAVIIEPPPPHAVRRHGSAWEVRLDGRWVPVESPLDRAARDAARVRRWIASEEHDFVVKVFAAVVTDDPSITRTPNAAVVPPDQVAAWLATLPPARSLSGSRRDDLIARVRSIA